MNRNHIALLISLLWIKLQTVQSQCWNGYNAINTLDGYSMYTYPYVSPSAYDCNSYGGVYSIPSTAEYYAPPCNTCPSDSNQPIVIIINGDIIDYDEWDLLNMLSLIPNLKEHSDGGPIYVSYPGSELYGNCNNFDCRCGYDLKCSNSCCKNTCGCSNSQKNDCLSIDDYNYSCCDCKKQRPKLDCGCNSGCRSSNCDCDRSTKCCNGKPKTCRC